ncbi:hypothetical protein [Flavobacterium psychrotolerans]|uniref:DUF4412 domain-containing protein n=1 Tax=Flavobacterium psychrotolerans TaxID=2169410 RepID=A0A2U1JGA3_9FLAO|nr:hypothetical protein [Flavobacterium psychrotolerans]PWA04176.1 hypothetical protein DB895_12405 [Flavobacterium psychrotolerans]
MKKGIVIVFSVLTTIAVFGQNFEGKIVYTNSYKSKKPEMSDQKWAALLGSTQEYFIKGGDYKSVTNGTLVQWQLYNNKENRLYVKMANSEAAFWNDASVQGDAILKVEVNKNATEVLGYKCDEVILTCESGLQKYYFNSKLAVDAKLFVNHKFGNWYGFLSESHALPLKSIIEIAVFTVESVATEVKPMKLDANTFELPEGIKTEKSPF